MNISFRYLPKNYKDYYVNKIKDEPIYLIFWLWLFEKKMKKIHNGKNIELGFMLFTLWKLFY